MKPWMVLVAAAIVMAVSCKKGDGVTTPVDEVPDHVAAFSSSENRLIVGACYYPWFTNGQHWGGDNLRCNLVPSQPPQLGLYDCASQAVISQHVRWSVQAGIDFWICSWWGEGSSTDRVILDGQLRNTDFRSSMGYCLLYEPQNGAPVTVTETTIQRFLNDLRYMMTEHFGRSNYLAIDKAPVLYVYLTRTMQGDVRGMFQRADSLLRTGGYSGLYVVGDEVYWGHITGTPLDYLDAVTDYNPHTSQTWVTDPVLFVSRLTNEVYDPWMTLANSASKSFWVDVIPGFNDLGVRPEAQHPVIGRRDTSTFLGMLAAAGPVLKRQAVPLKVLVVTSWNEWHEDTQIEPTIVATTPTQNPFELTRGNWYVGYGTHYLNILKNFKTDFNAKTSSAGAGGGIPARDADPLRGPEHP